MRIKLPENFGSISHAGTPVEFNPDADGCVDVEDGVAQALLSHGGTLAPDVAEANAAIDAELDANNQRAADLASRKQKGGRISRAPVADNADKDDE